MEQNSMTGDPNQKVPFSVFGFDQYPGPNGTMFPVNPNSQPTSPFLSQNAQKSCFNHFPTLTSQSFQSPISSTSVVLPQIPRTFSFGPQPTVKPMGGQFPWKITTRAEGNQQFKLVLGKRKTDSPSLQPKKQHITEEKMAEHMSKLHISSESVPSPLEPDTLKNKRLYMCEEMRRLQNEPIIPPTIVAPIPRPCTALVLWQPPSKLIPIVGNEPSPSTSKFDSSTNNDEGIQEMDSESTGTMDLDS